MTITKNVDPNVYYGINAQIMGQVNDYINKPMTATTFSKKDEQKKQKRFITSELIYSWMISLGIPMECQKWHLNRLMTLIKVCDIENNPSPSKKKKMTQAELNAYNHALNAKNRAKFGTRG